ncbi:MAG: DNA translocase FtsK, partial [candidate division Zixibacteria bacterium]|nr:DNA translocase FtsK [candidate division Zixibacteria bacterium]
TAKTLRETLETFGVGLSGSIEMFPGPIITRFEIKPAAGVKVNQIANLSEDLALNLRAKSIRIVAPIPGKAAVGIEIPNRQSQIVNLRELIQSDAFIHSSHHLPIILGKDIAGKPYVADLAAMPHLLIAGTTGSGKSVCINVVITSLIYSLRPEDLHFIFVDPKMLELSVYKDIPYLREKVVTNAKQAERVLADAVTEMEERYRVLASASVRSIVDYNAKQKKQQEKLPYIVIIIDELADLMMSASSSRVELLITRLAQMARAVGIHLILATQRPSVDVITGLIKANFPSRIAFQVATKIDSRTILDGNGAEKLLGKGDMLFVEAGLPEPLRLHGAYISSEETERIVTFIKEQPYSQVKQEEVQAASDERAQMRQFTDPVLLEAIETVIRQGQASVSLLQRKLGVGYQRAARLIDELEEMKVIGEYNESKAREVLVDKVFLDNIKSGKIGKP